MPVDASIPLRVQTADIPSPLDVYGRYLGLKSAITRDKIADIQLRDLQRQENEIQQQKKDEDVIRQALADVNGDWTKLPEAVAGKVSPQTYSKLLADIEAHRKRVLDSSKEQLELDLKKMQALGSIAGSIQDENTYKAGVQRAYQMGLLDKDQAERLIGQPWNDETKSLVEQFRQSSLSAQQQLENSIKYWEQQRAAQRQSAELTGIQADVERKQLENAASQLASATNAQEYQAIWEQLPAGIALRFPRPDQWNKETPNRVRLMGMAPKDQAEALKASRPFLQEGATGTYLVDPNTGEAKEVKTPAGEPIVKPGSVPRTPEGMTIGQAIRRADDAKREHDELQMKEQELHSKRIRIGQAITALRKAQSEGKDRYVAPDGKEYPATEEQANALGAELEGATRLIDVLQRRQRDIRAQFGWGEFGRSPQFGAPPSDLAENSGPELPSKFRWMAYPAKVVDSEQQSNAQGPVPSVTQDTKIPARGTPEGRQRIRVRLADGRTGTIEASEFDPNTMTRLPWTQVR